MAVENPSEYLSMIVDGMDQNKTNIPSLVRISCIVHNFIGENFSGLAKMLCAYIIYTVTYVHARMYSYVG